MVKKLLTFILGLGLAAGASATINFPASNVQYWVGTGSNSAVVIIGWDDNPNGNFALAWGVRWSGSAMAVNMLDTIATYDSRVAYAINSGFVTQIGYNDGTLVSGSSASYWCYTINGGYASAYGTQPMTNGDVMEISSSCSFSLTSALAATDPNAVPATDPVDATIAFSDILYWVGEGSNQVVMAVNWADTALAWGYRFDTEQTTSTLLMDAVAAADPRFSYIMGVWGLGDIRYIDTATGMTDTLGIAPGNYWWSLLNGEGAMGMGTPLRNGDLFKWGDLSVAVVIDSTWEEYAGLGYWNYSYVWPYTITPVSVPDTTSTPDPVDPQPGHGPFCGAVGTEGCDAIAADSSAIVAWATGCTLDRGPQNIAVEGSPTVTYPTTGNPAEQAIGSCSMNDNLSVVSLGDGGSATLTFAKPIRNGVGPDFAVYENSFNDTFLELAFVEVSSDGERFVRFPATSLTQTETQATSIDPTYINNLAGKYRTGYGTPFDLEELRDSTGINIDSIVYVRVVDVVGSIDPQYATYDAFGHVVNDPWPTDSYSGGFDLDGVAVIHQAEVQGIDGISMAINGLWPNPTVGKLHVNANRPAEAVLYDFAGRQMAVYNLVSGTNTLDLNALPAGIYMLRAEGSVSKIVKQ